MSSGTDILTNPQDYSPSSPLPPGTTYTPTPTNHPLAHPMTHSLGHTRSRLRRLEVHRNRRMTTDRVYRVTSEALQYLHFRLQSLVSRKEPQLP